LDVATAPAVVQGAWTDAPISGNGQIGLLRQIAGNKAAIS